MRNDDFDNRTVKLPVPVEPGTYEVRYWNGDSKKDLATASLTVTEIAVELSAPAEIGQGRSFKVVWDGPGAPYDEVQLFDPDANGGEGRKFSSKRVRNDDFDNKTVRLTAPVTTGVKELRYYNGDSRKVLATRPIEVVAIDISLDAPEAVEVETRFAVIWAGPGARYDEIRIVEKASGKRASSKRLRNDDFDNNKVTITAPKAPGEYLLQYYNGDSKAVLAEQALSVN